MISGCCGRWPPGSSSCTPVQIQEQGRVDDVLANPQHPYTKALIQAVPDPDSTDQRLHQIEGQPPDLLNLPEGCSFADRCAFVMPKCQSERPELYTSPRRGPTFAATCSDRKRARSK